MCVCVCVWRWGGVNRLLLLYLSVEKSLLTQKLKPLSLSAESHSSSGRWRLRLGARLSFPDEGQQSD